MTEHRCLSPWKGALAGGLIVFAWQAVSWMALPFHEKTLHVFSDAAPVVHAVEAVAPASGVYILHNDPTGQTAPTDPFLFVSYHKEGWGSMGGSMGIDVLVLMAAAFLWTWILGKIPGLAPADAALYGLFFGVAAGLVGPVQNWIYWKFPLPFTLMYVADSAIGWTLASLAISRCRAAACELPK
jgi:hypothetical protein